MGSKENQFEPDVDAIYRSLQEGVMRRQQEQEKLRQQEYQQEVISEQQQHQEQLLEQFLEQERQQRELERQQEFKRQQEIEKQQEELKQQRELERQQEELERQQEILRQQEYQRQQRRQQLQELEFRELSEDRKKKAAASSQRQAQPLPQVQTKPKPAINPVPMPISVKKKAVPAPGVIKHKKRRIPRYYKVLLIVSAVMLTFIFAGAAIFWGYMAAYEASLPEPIISDLLDNIDYDFWESKVTENIVSLLTEFERENADYILRPYISLVTDAAYTIRQKRDENTGDRLVYILRAGSRDIGEIHLASRADAGYGFSTWEVSSIEYLNSFTDGLAGSIRITASQTAQVLLNGIPVTSDYSVPCDTEFGASYLIENIFGDVIVTVTERDGQVSAPYYAENGEFLYSIIKPFSREFDITAPGSAEVFVDNEKITSESIAEEMIIPNILEGYFEPSDVPFYSVHYKFKIEELYSEPEVTAVDTGGRELIRRDGEDGRIVYTFTYSDELKELHEDMVEAFIRAYVKYNANIDGNVQTNFNDLSRYIVRDSDLYSRTYSSLASGANWAGGDSVTYNSLEIDNFMPYGDEYFTCQIRYNITNKTLYESREVIGSFEVLFVLTGEEWLAARMIII